jgi:heat shock protein HtpX
MFITNPLSGRSLMSLFSTHPPIEERIAKLMGRQAPGAAPPSEEAGGGRTDAGDIWERLKGGR